MQYTLNIDYVDNPEKCGKLTLTTENDFGEKKVLLKKVPVTIPTNLDLFEISLNKDNNLEVVLNKDLLAIDKDNLYKDSYSKLIANNSDNVFIKSSQEKILFKSSNDSILCNDRESFVLHKDAFKILSESLKFAKKLNFLVNEVSFLFFPEKNINNPQNTNELYRNFLSVESNLNKLLKEKANNVVPLNVIQPQYLQKKVEPSKIPQENIHKRKIVKENNFTSSYNNDDVDALDVLLMYNYPEMAPFLKPNSLLAWYFYFNNEEKEINKHNVENSFRNVQGFENVESSDFMYTNKGYSLKLYSDENKTNLIGKLEYDNEKQCYSVKSPNGQESFLNIYEDGKMKSCITSSNGNELNMDLVNSKNGIVGNWEIDNNGIKINSSIKINDNFDYESSPNNKIDLNSVEIKTEKSYGNKPQDDYSPSYDTSNKYEVKEEYVPPPPPPPPRDTWSSGDPYSNSKSFSM